MIKPKENNRLVFLLNAIISIILIVVILYYVGLSDVIHIFSKIDFGYLGWSIFFLLLMYMGMVFRIKLLLNASDVSISLESIIRSHLVGMLLADFTPARIGYFIAATKLHTDHKVQSEKALLSIFGPQIFDFALKLIVGTIAVYYLLINFLKAENSTILFLGTAVMTVFISIMLLALFSSKFLRFFSFISHWLVIGSFYQTVERMQQHSHVVIKKAPVLVMFLLYTWSMKAISWYFVAKSLGITINVSPFPEILFYYFFQPLITMLEFVPSPTLAGLGLSEGGGTLVMALFGVSLPLAAAFTLLARVKTTLVNLLAVPDSLKLLNKLHNIDWKKIAH